MGLLATFLAHPREGLNSFHLLSSVSAPVTLLPHCLWSPHLLCTHLDTP